LSDIKIKRIYLEFQTYWPFKYISYISLYDGDNAVKGMAVTSDNVYEVASGWYRISLTGLDVLVEKGTTKNLTVKVNAVSVYPSGYAGKTITMRLPASGVRGVDGAGVNQYAPAGPDTHTFDLASAITGSLDVGINADTPETGVAIVSDTESTEVEVARFDLEAENLDVTVDEIVASTTDSNVASYRLYDGTTLLDEVASAASITFDDLDLTITKDTTKTLTIKAVVNATTSVEAGSSTVTNITVPSGGAYDANYEQLTSSEISGDADGNTIYFYTIAPVISVTSATADGQDNNATTGEETGVFTIKTSLSQLKVMMCIFRLPPQHLLAILRNQMVQQSLQPLLGSSLLMQL